MVVVMLIAGMPLVVPLGVLLFTGSMIPLIGMLVTGSRGRPGGVGHQEAGDGP